MALFRGESADFTLVSGVTAREASLGSSFFLLRGRRGNERGIAGTMRADLVVEGSGFLGGGWVIVSANEFPATPR